jgi:hypothetical protein
MKSSVIGHYQPLADSLGIAPKPDQARSLQSDQRASKIIEKTMRNAAKLIRRNKAGSSQQSLA